MENYVISSTPDRDSQEYDVTLRGPGLDPQGRHYVFRTEDRCQSFIDAVNFAYRQGLANGRRQARKERNEPLIVISGHSPELLVSRPERWWERAIRVLLGR
jgi:hypothetical protein